MFSNAEVQRPQCHTSRVSMPHLDDRKVWRLPCSGVAFEGLGLQTLSFHSLPSVRLPISSRQERKEGMAVCATCTSPSSPFFLTTKSFFLLSSTLLLSSLLFSTLTRARAGFSIFITVIQVIIIILPFFIFAKSFQVVWQFSISCLVVLYQFLANCLANPVQFPCHFWQVNCTSIDGVFTPYIFFHV